MNVLRFAVALCVIAVAAPVMPALSPAALAANPAVKIPRGPLSAGQSNVHPNLVLTMSIDYTTTGAAYRNANYDRTVEYVGYFNPLKCYVYHGGNRNLTDEGYFEISANADRTTHECNGNAFSGNFMNWAASSTLDMMRYALTGGDRVIDTSAATVVQRAVLRDDGTDNFYAHSQYFPRRIVTAAGNSSAPGRVTPFNTATLYVVSCRNRILFSDASSGLAGDRTSDAMNASRYCTSRYSGKGAPGPEAADKKLGEYLVRIKVCDAREAPERSDLCHRYGSHYKPVGEIQRRSDRLRLAAMSYLLDDSPKRYGGVLRSPMKHVGPGKFAAPKFMAEENELREWDPETGVFYANPDEPAARQSPAAGSGVINYVNKFGRAGRYKTNDPLSELYYESLRYLQGRQPTPDGAAGATEAMRDGFPVVSYWADPVGASCQRNYIVAIADANTRWDRYVPGNEGRASGSSHDAHDPPRPADAAVAGRTPHLDVTEWTRKVGDMESAAVPGSAARFSGLHNREAGDAGLGSYYIAGLAHWAHSTDIRLDLRTRVTTFAVGLDDAANRLPTDPQNPLYLAAKYGGSADGERIENPFLNTAVSDHPSLPESRGAGHLPLPSNYFPAGEPRELIQAIRTVFARTGALAGVWTGAALSATTMASDEEFAYLAGFDASGWSGSLRKVALSMDRKDGFAIAEVADWDAGGLLTGSRHAKPFPLPDARKIYAGTVRSDRSVATVEFRWSELSDAQKAQLDASPADKHGGGLGEERLRYLRGHRDREIGRPAGIFRTRNRVLGDIVNSSPVHVGAPSPNVQGDGYLDFLNASRDRTRAVYVGANDGMLHAFSAADGTELFAYVPNAVFRNLHQLTHPAYVHQPYVDGQISVAEAKVRGGWKTVLAAGMGGGAQGVFALDVTDPAAFGSGIGALWEFTDADDGDMGNLLGPPQIAQFITGMVDGAPRYKFFAVVSSGLNNYESDGAGRFNRDGAGALFLLSLDKHPSEKWQAGVNYFKFRTPSQDGSLPNGLAAPALVKNAQGAVRYAYAGDLQGNLWRFDFSGAAPWTNAVRKTPLFVAMDGGGRRQPVTVQPKVVFAPGSGYIVLFGTGKLLEESDTLSAAFRQQSFYGIHDTTDARYSVQGRSQLAARQLQRTENGELAVTGSAVSYGAADGQVRGWYVDFLEGAATGERSVTPAFLADGRLYFNTMLPSAAVCAGGSGRSYVLGALTGLVPGGGPTGHLSRIGIPGMPMRIDTRTDLGPKNTAGRRTVTKKHAVITAGTGGPGSAIPAEHKAGESTVPAGRFSWREISNWQELHRAHRK